MRIPLEDLETSDRSHRRGAFTGKEGWRRGRKVGSLVIITLANSEFIRETMKTGGLA